jgi:hypothetical protein
MQWKRRWGPLEMKEKIAHASFAVGDQMFSGSMPANYLKPQGFDIQLNLTDELEAERILGRSRQTAQ